MIYKLNIIKTSDNLIEKIYHQAMKELGLFYDIKWTVNTPKIVLLKDRNSIDLLRVKKTELWLVAWADSGMRKVFILDRKALSKHSSHKYTEEHYSQLLKHELSHLFYKILSNGKTGPVWLSEGVAIYTSGQTTTKPRPTIFKNFLSFYDTGGSGVYIESGFVVTTLVNKFGKGKLLELIKALKEVADEKQFIKVFKKIYGISLTYREINSLHA